MDTAFALEAAYVYINRRRARKGEEDVREKYGEDAGIAVHCLDIPCNPADRMPQHDIAFPIIATCADRRLRIILLKIITKVSRPFFRYSFTWARRYVSGYIYCHFLLELYKIRRVES